LVNQTDTPFCIRAFVTGKVQGVFYRDSTRKKAKELGVTGWAKNLANGQVEVLACGSREAVMNLAEWLWQGSPRANVSNVTWEAINVELHETFRII
jgi:acylphosphatase